MEKLLTVVIPVYKVEKYIHQCLDSLIMSNEQMEQLEVIIVNDGTPDRSAEMAKEYEKRFPHVFRVIDKENGGHGSAWNRGLKEAKGKYIRFLDSDDWLTNLVPFTSRLSEVDADIVLTPLNKYYEDEKRSVIDNFTNLQENHVYDADSFDWKANLKFSATDFWYATYRTSILQKYCPLFVEKVSYDDAILFIAPILLAKSFMYMNIVLYNYRLGREGQSVDKKVQSKRALDYKPVSMSMIDFIDKHENVSREKKRMIEAIMSYYLNNCFNFFKYLSYGQFKNNIREWYLFIMEHCPYVKKSRSMRIYESCPFPMFWAYLKVSSYLSK